jgi:hypothetical protein
VTGLPQTEQTPLCLMVFFGMPAHLAVTMPVKMILAFLGKKFQALKPAPYHSYRLMLYKYRHKKTPYQKY